MKIVWRIISIKENDCNKNLSGNNEIVKKTFLTFSNFLLLFYSIDFIVDKKQKYFNYYILIIIKNNNCGKTIRCELKCNH